MTRPFTASLLTPWFVVSSPIPALMRASKHVGRIATVSAALWLLVASWSLAPLLPCAVAQEGAVVEPEADGWKGLRPRPLFREPELASIEPGFSRDFWIVKFHEGTRIRLRDGVFVNDEDPRDGEEQRRLRRLNLDPQAVAAGLRETNGWLQRFRASAEPHFERPEAELEAWRLSGEKNSGRELADLNLYYTYKVDPRVGEAQLLAALRDLRAIAVVETAFPLPLPQDSSISTSLTPQQTYRTRPALGIDDVYAESHPGANGAGVRIIDVEGGWNTGHCDLPGLFFSRGLSSQPGHHGTAVLGIMAGLNDGVGVTGICHRASFGISSVANVNGPYALGSAIDSAAAAVGLGDVVLIEQHLLGPDPGTTCNCNCLQFRYIAVEYWPVYFDAIASATAMGRIVVEAGGNGSMNLDDPVYGGRFDRTVRDSGAIIVGARCSGLSGRDGCRVGNLRPTCWTNFGTRVDVCAWGQDVVTTGYGNHPSSGPTVDDFYENDFGGTSSASPIVVGAVAEIQGYLRARGRASLDPWTMRELLVQTGTAHAPDARHIGPMPNIRHALHELVRMSVASGDFNGDGIVDLAIGNPWAEVNGRSGAGKVSICLSSRDHSSSRVSYEISQGSTTVDLADNPEENDWFGFALAAGDFNGDGIDDLGIGVPGEDFRTTTTLNGGGIENEGRVQVVYGSAAGVGLGSLAECMLRQSGLGGGPANNVDLPGTSETGDLLGYALACGDVDGDGFDDLVMGAPGESFGAVPRTGMVELIFGSSAPFSNADPSTARFSSVAADNLLSRSVHVNDLDADGFAELIVGTPGFDTPTTQDVGRVLVYMANAGGIPATPLVIGPGDLLAKTTDDENGDGSINMTDLVFARMGESLTSGRTGGGTRNYLYLGAPGFGDSNRIGAGAVLEVLDPQNPSLGKLLQQDTSSAFSNLPGTAGRFDLTGTGLASGDFNGDGLDDLAVGAPGEGVAVDSGAVRVVDGFPLLGVSTSTGTASFSEASWPSGTPAFAELFGATVLSLDHNGDGFQDLLVLKPGAGTSASAPDLSLRFLYGSASGLQPSTGDWCEVGEIINTMVVTAAFIRGDANKDGVVGMDDSMWILEVLFRGRRSPSCQDRLVTNDDGALDLSDTVAILRYLFGGGFDIPTPFPAVGLDPTSDSLPCKRAD